MIRIKNLSIVAKISLILLLSGAVSLASAYFASTRTRAINDGYTMAVAHQDKAAIWMSRATSALKGQKGYIAELIMSDSDGQDAAARESFVAQRKATLTYLDRAGAADPSQREAIENLRRVVLDLVDNTCGKAIALGGEIGKTAAAQAEYLHTCGPAYGPVLAKMVKHVDDAMAAQERTAERLSAMANSTITINFAVAVLSTLVILVLSFFAVRAWVSRPIRDLAQTMRQVAGGDLTMSVEGTDRRDEIGPMAQALQVFKDNGLKLQASEAEASRVRERAEVERQANEATRAELQRQQGRVVSALAQGLDALSHGDLTNELHQQFPAEYEKLRADFNATAQSLREAMETIASATNGINSGSDQIAAASDNIARRTEQQAASLEETAAALNLITDTVKRMAAGASEGASVAQTTRSAAENSGMIVQEAIQAMSRIKDSSGQITQIIGVIDEIAFQTNLLALNAGVEAARAGDAGRGFAVVASEVRGLAQRSAEAAKEIKALISTSTVEVNHGVTLVDRTGAALREIIEQIATMDRLAQQISSSSREQATGLAEINTAVGQMDQVVQQNAAMVEESTAAAHALRSETQDLTTMVARFKTGGGASQTTSQNPVHSQQAALARYARG